MENIFTFTAQDCIELRKQVIQFYSRLIGQKRPNVVDFKNPHHDVVSDFQVLMYVFMIIEANREVERAAEVMMNGKPVIRQEAKIMLGAYSKKYNAVRMLFPFQNMTFVSQYSDVDEALNDAIGRLVQQTYYPLLNNMLKENPGIPSEIQQVMAHLITSLCLSVLACEKGMRDTHAVRSQLVAGMPDSICRIAAAVDHIHSSKVKLDENMLEQIVEKTADVLINVTQFVLNDIYYRAESLDLTAYKEAADYSKEDFNNLIDTRIKQRNDFIKHVCTRHFTFPSRSQGMRIPTSGVVKPQKRKSKTTSREHTSSLRTA